jgi:hypothetical protein
MSLEAIEVQISVTHGSLPVGDDHPFWVALEALAEALPAHGTVMIASSDTPDWAHRMRIGLPAETAQRRQVIELALNHLSNARRALPGADWTVTLGGAAPVWDSSAGFQQGPA